MIPFGFIAFDFFQCLFCMNIFHNIHYIHEHVLQPTGYTDHQSQERLLILSSMYFLLKWCLHHTTVKGNCYIKSNYLLIFNSTLFFYLKTKYTVLTFIIPITYNLTALYIQNIFKLIHLILSHVPKL